jgi:hypothetical protein
MKEIKDNKNVHNGDNRREYGMDGLYFYWLFWCGWIISTFFIDKQNPYRLKVSFWILVAISISTTGINSLGLTISGTGIWIIISVYWVISKLELRKVLYFFISGFIVMLGTVCFFLFELYDPVWVIFETKWLLAILIACLAILLHSDKYLRILVLMHGMIHGEIFYAIILKSYTFPYPVASLSFLDSFSISVSLLVLWNGLENVIAYFEKYIGTTEKGKQKVT